ncbi:MAG: bacillithiol biosynthesis BshC, partial [Flavobacteriaceae bacterium]|nr:bacillithiol biosynthesis BshC [Flavobacteriaceae bacterium]
DIFNNAAFETVTATNKQLEDYKIQVNPREINIFYLKDNLRERLVFQDGKFNVLETDIAFTQAEIEQELEQHPERFSPNVIMRPLYQEVILPNLCYIGGGGELAYWLQLKSFFESQSVPFPVLLLRNSVLLVTEKQDEKLKKLNIAYKDIFLNRDRFINKKVREISNIDIDFS